MCLNRIYSYFNRRDPRQYGSIVRKYLLSDYEEYHEGMTTVPEDSIYVEEWRRGSSIRRRVLYEGEAITEFAGNPFTPIKNPWSCIGDVSTDVDLTYALDRYLMVGNRIQLDLIFWLVRVHDDIRIMYTEPTSDREFVFPNEGVSIVADESA